MVDVGAIQILSLQECLIIIQNDLGLSSNELIDIESYAVVSGSNELVGFMGEYFKLKVKLSKRVSLNKL